ncbi:hypothetical protein [Corallococcus sp. EGB]|uniref:hypothetical protein n=1 Tax=Corallococcus sp. EGB TaxID=1521117 RepID=UPI001CBCB30D|nr:hypothetical protein [Corallococcus sp. EGB]
MKRFVLATLVALLGACFDPLYEDPDLLGGVSWAVCCVRGQVDTCPCDDGDTCNTSFKACASGTCTASRNDSCAGPATQDAGGVPNDGGVNIEDAGTPSDAGTESDAGTATDAGASTDGGIPMDAGVDGGVDGGPQPSYGYEPCCPPGTHRVTTCVCAASGCGSTAPFTPCSSGRCALAGESCG